MFWIECCVAVPAVKKIVYSTCSIYQRENEDVVRAVLQYASDHDFHLRTPFPNWPQRGLPIFEGGSHHVFSFLYVYIALWNVFHLQISDSLYGMSFIYRQVILCVGISLKHRSINSLMMHPSIFFNCPSHYWAFLLFFWRGGVGWLRWRRVECPMYIRGRGWGRGLLEPTPPLECCKF